MKLMWNLFTHNRLSSVNLPRELKQNHYATRNSYRFRN